MTCLVGRSTTDRPSVLFATSVVKAYLTLYVESVQFFTMRFRVGYCAGAKMRRVAGHDLCGEACTVCPNRERLVRGLRYSSWLRG